MPPKGVMAPIQLNPGLTDACTIASEYNDPLNNNIPKKKNLPAQINLPDGKSLYKIPTANNANT